MTDVPRVDAYCDIRGKGLPGLWTFFKAAMLGDLIVHPIANILYLTGIALALLLWIAIGDVVRMVKIVVVVALVKGYLIYALVRM